MSNQGASDRPLSVQGAADYLGVKPRYVRHLVEQRKVRFLKVGHLLRFKPRDLDRFLEGAAIEPLPMAHLADS